MARKGGYQVVDLKGTGLTVGTARVIDGVASQIANSNKKRLVVSGLVVASVDYNDFEVAMTQDDDNYTLTGGGFTITVAKATGAVTANPTNAA